MIRVLAAIVGAHAAGWEDFAAVCSGFALLVGAAAVIVGAHGTEIVPPRSSWARTLL